MKRAFLYLICFVTFYSCNEKKEYSKKESIERNVEHLQKSIEWNNKRIQLVNKDTTLLVSSKDMLLIKEYLKYAIDEAEKVDTIVLNSVKDGYGNIYYNKYLKGMKMELKGIEEGNNKMSIDGQLKYDEFLKWINKNGL
ncbi:hypothetical protein H4K35_09890 [Myroides sp. NP-2]|uniref:hypothetical protein n=1 Tax=Myroides sp. NP-2 TaxID=2759945 RepID=UPI0015F83A91|nr:hypothetical protein [Myroides sp. NP-2]MBB1150425.1 hypothetical protein [Myroides sp. NP-2]